MHFFFLKSKLHTLKHPIALLQEKRRERKWQSAGSGEGQRERALILSYSVEIKPMGAGFNEGSESKIQVQKNQETCNK